MGIFDDAYKNPEMDKLMPSGFYTPQGLKPPTAGPPPGEFSAFAPQQNRGASGSWDAPQTRAMAGRIGAQGIPVANPGIDQTPYEGEPPDPMAPAGMTMQIPTLGQAARVFSNPILAGQFPDQPQNATVDPSLAAPRQPHQSFSGWNSAAQTEYNNTTHSVGVPQVDRPPGLPGGPITDAVAPRDYGTELRAMQAREAQSNQDRQNQSLAGGRAAQTSFDLNNAKQAAAVSRFRATDGADMVLAPENAGYDDQRRAIIDVAKNDAGIVNGLQGQLNANQNDQIGKTNYINDFAKSQEEINRGKVADRVGAVGAVENEGRKLDNAAKQQLMTLKQQLGAETDPAKQKILQNKILAIEGKQPQQDKVAVIDIDTGQKDIMGQPIYKKAAINIATGDLLGAGQQGGGGKAAPPADLDSWLKAAKAQNPNASIDELTKYYKDKYAQ